MNVPGSFVGSRDCALSPSHKDLNLLMPTVYNSPDRQEANKQENIDNNNNESEQ